MNELNKKYLLQMEVLTPLHVGAGAEKDWVQGSDFVVHEGKVKVLNLKKVAQFVNVDDLTKALLEKNSSLLLSKLAGNLDKCVDAVFDSTYFGTNDIKTCIKNGMSNQPIVPGSSLKGAIRSVLLDVLHTKSQISNAKDNNGRWTEQVLFGSANKGDEYFRFIKISDAQFEETGLVNTKIFNLKSQVGGWKHERDNTTNKFNHIGFNTYYEIINTGAKSIFSISMATKAFENFGILKFEKNKQELINNHISGLFSLINSHTKEYLKKENAFFQKYATDKTGRILESIEKLLGEIPSNGEYCILKMAAGSGFHNITGDWQFDDYSINGLDTSKKVSRGLLNGQKSAKSRKIAILSDNEFCLMGFVKLKPISEEEFQQIETEKQEQKIELEKRRKEKAEILAEQKRKEKLEMRLLAEKRLHYDELLMEAQVLFENQEPEAAKYSIDKAIELFPNEIAHNVLNIQITKAINIKLQDEENLKAAQALEQARIDSNKIPLSEKISKADKFPTIFGNLKTWMKLNELQRLEKTDIDALTIKLIDVYSKMKPNAQKHWLDFKKWTELSKVVGEEVAKMIFNKVLQ
ncbi:MAG: hypothetical protein BGP01_07225 [Paludibacter sp. 47-17]|nr:MAG: hypothetical protein BGP01_07225 [Paludibacter sp. 47-17]